VPFLQAITSLKKLCNHPKLIYDAIVKSKGKQAAVGFEVSKASLLASHAANIGSPSSCDVIQAQSRVPGAEQFI